MARARRLGQRRESRVLIEPTGVGVIALYAIACYVASQGPRRHGVTEKTHFALRVSVPPWLVIVAHVVMIAMCAGLMLHVVPGFYNPPLISNVVLSPGGIPYTKYLNVDKLTAGLLLLAIYRRRTERSKRSERSERSERSDLPWRFAVVLVAVMVLALALGFVRWDPKLPSWFPLWAAALLVFTVMPEEALFRGVVQPAIARWLGDADPRRRPRAELTAMVIAGTLFGVAHLAGGARYVVLATVAGIGYGWIFARTRSMTAAIAAHTGVDVVHFLLFTYPALSLHGQSA